MLFRSNYLFIDGDFKAGCSGYESWNPLVVPAASFFGVTRNTGNITRKAGIRKDVSATVGAVNKIRKALTATSMAFWERRACGWSHRRRRQPAPWRRPSPCARCKGP